MFVNKYQNNQSAWLEATPKLQIASTPLDAAGLLSLREREFHNVMLSNINDYSQGGLYSEEMQKKFGQRLERYRGVQYITSMMMDNANSRVFEGASGGRPLSPSDVFPHVDIPWTSSLWSHLHKWYNNWGTFWAVMFGLYSTYCIVKGTVTWLMRFFLLRGKTTNLI